MAEEANNPKYPLYPLVRAWAQKIQLALDFKKSLFQDDADEAMKFFHCGKDLQDVMFQRHKKVQDVTDDEEELPAPRFRVVVGKVAEIVELFGPSLYHRNPVCLVEPKNLDIPLDLLLKLVPPQVLQQAQQAAQMQGQQFNPASLFPPDPEEAMSQITAVLLQFYLNYIQFENDKKTHSRRMIDEALIKGAGLLWTESYSAFEGAPELVGSFYDTIDNLVIDPDADHFDEIKWLARRCIHPVQDVAKEYELDEEWLRKKFGTHESLNSQGESIANEQHKRDRTIGRTNDVMEYWKIYSKMGMGHKLAGLQSMEDLDSFLDSLGQNCLIVINKDVHFPLNLHTKHVKDLAGMEEGDDFEEAHAETIEKVSWPIPFWADGEWPCTLLSFHDVPNSPWPMPHIKPGLGYLKFINWTMSFLCNRLRTSCRTVVATMKAAEEEIKQQLMNGKDFQVVELPANVSDDIRKVIQFLEVPQVQGDVWKVIEAVFDLFDKATGLTELAYAMPGGMRSAAEAQQKGAAQNVRPDDMANKVEDCMSLIARKEAMSARWLLDAQSVMPVLGKRGANLWQQYVMSGDILKVAREYNYRIEAGSMRKPNKDTEISNLMQALQQWAPLIAFCLQNHMFDQVNALIEQYGKAFDFDVKKMLLPPPPPPPPNPMQQKVEAEIEKGKAELAIKQQESQIKQQGIQAEIQLKHQQHQMEAEGTKMRTQAEMARAGMEMQMDQARMGHEMVSDRQKAQNDLQMQRMEMGQRMAAAQLGMLGDGLAQSLKLRQEHEAHKQRMAQGAMKPKGADHAGTQR